TSSPQSLQPTISGQSRPPSSFSSSPARRRFIVLVRHKLINRTTPSLLSSSQELDPGPSRHQRHSSRQDSLVALHQHRHYDATAESGLFVLIIINHTVPQRSPPRNVLNLSRLKPSST